MRRTLASLVVSAALMTALNGCAEDAEEREARLHEERRHEQRVGELKAKGISGQTIARYEKAGADTFKVDKLIDADVTLKIFEQLKNKENLKPWEISDLVERGGVWNKVEFGKSRFNGKEYQQFRAHELPLAVYASSKRNGLTLEAAMNCINLGFAPTGPDYVDGFLILAAHRIGCDDAKRIQQQGLDVNGIINKYAEAAGVKPLERVAYLRMGFDDAQMKFLSGKGLNTDMVSRLTHVENPLKKEDIINFAAQGKLTGDIYNEFVGAGGEQVEAAYALRKGKDLRKAANWLKVGYSVETMIACDDAGISLYRALEIKEKYGLEPHQAAQAVQGYRRVLKNPDLIIKK